MQALARVVAARIRVAARAQAAAATRAPARRREAPAERRRHRDHGGERDRRARRVASELAGRERAPQLGGDRLARVRVQHASPYERVGNREIDDEALGRRSLELRQLGDRDAVERLRALQRAREIVHLEGATVGLRQVEQHQGRFGEVEGAIVERERGLHVPEREPHVRRVVRERGIVRGGLDQRLIARIRFPEPAAAPRLHRERARRERIARIRRREAGEIDGLRQTERRGGGRFERRVGREGEQRRAGEPRNGKGARDHAGGRDREHDALARPAVGDGDRQQRERETEPSLAEQREREHETAEERGARERGHLAGDRIAQIVRRVRRRKESRCRDAQQAPSDEPHRSDQQARRREPERGLEMARDSGERRERHAQRS